MRCFPEPSEERQQAQHNARQQNYLDDAVEHGVCLAAKPLTNIAPLPNTTIKTLITTANTDGMKLLLYPFGRK